MINWKLFDEANDVMPNFYLGEGDTLNPNEINTFNKNLLELVEVKKRLNTTILIAKKRFERRRTFNRDK